MGRTVQAPHTTTASRTQRHEARTAHPRVKPDRERGDQPRSRHLRQRLNPVGARPLREHAEPERTERERLERTHAVHAQHVRRHPIRAVLDLVPVRVSARGRLDVAAGQAFGLGLLTADREQTRRERELRGLWLSRLMFNMFVGWPPENRSFEEFLADHAVKP